MLNMKTHELTPNSGVELRKENRFVLLLDITNKRCALSIGPTSHYLHEQAVNDHLNNPKKYLKIAGFYTPITKQASVTGINDLPITTNDAHAKAGLKLLFEAFKHHNITLETIHPNEEHGNIPAITRRDLD